MDAADAPAAARTGTAVAGAAAGALAVVLFLLAALLSGDGPSASAPGSEVADFYANKRTEIQIGCALIAAAAPLLVWFLATVLSVARAQGRGAALLGTVAFGCGVAFLAVFLVDVTTLAVGALRPGNMAADPRLARALRDIEFLAMGTAALLAAAMLAAFATLALRHAAIWPRWVGALGLVAAPLYALRVGVLFTDDGPFAASGALGLYVPVAALVGWLLLASLVLAADLAGRRRREPG